MNNNVSKYQIESVISEIVFMENSKFVQLLKTETIAENKSIFILHNCFISTYSQWGEVT